MVLKKKRGTIASHLKEITGAQTLESARKRLYEAVETLESSHPAVEEHLDTYGEEILAVHALPEHHRKHMRSTNMLERLN
jgi:transposase-like protein